MSKKITESNLKPEKEVKLTKSVAGFPHGHRFIVVNSKKKSGYVGGHHYEFTIEVISKDEQANNKATVHIMPLKYLKLVK